MKVSNFVGCRPGVWMLLHLSGEGRPERRQAYIVTVAKV
jgi:hypothetical protein